MQLLLSWNKKTAREIPVAVGGVILNQAFAAGPFGAQRQKRGLLNKSHGHGYARG
jgi:hypothetical protein